MTTTLLHQLRLRLGTIQRRIADAEGTPITDHDWFYQQGRLGELRSEQLFVAGMMDSIEAMAITAEVTP